MKSIVKLVLGSVLVVCLAGAAHASPVSLSTNFNVWHGNNPNPGVSTDPTQQADPANPLSSQTFIGFFSFSGPINFSNTSQATDLMSNFIPGVGLPAVQMSAPPYDVTSLFEFTFVLPVGVTIDSITHDDGISLFDLTTNSANLIPGNEGPTTAVTTLLPALTAGDNYEVWYVAANGAPSILSFNGSSAVPEPATWAMLILGFAGLGYAGYRRKLARVTAHI
jgi:hypothetical protein